MRRYQNAADLSGRFAIRLPQKVRMFQEILGMERLRKAKPVLLAIAAVCGLLVTVGGGAETPSAARQATIAASPAHAHQSGKSSGPAQSSLDFETYRTRIRTYFPQATAGRRALLRLPFGVSHAFAVGAAVARKFRVDNKTITPELRSHLSVNSALRPAEEPPAAAPFGTRGRRRFQPYGRQVLGFAE